MQTARDKNVFVRARRQPVQVPDVSDTLRGRAEAGRQGRRLIWPAGTEGRPLAAPSVYPGQHAGHCQISAICCDKLRQFRQRPLDMGFELVRLGVDQARRDAGDHMLECGPPPQCNGSRSKPQTELDKNPQQQQRDEI